MLCQCMIDDKYKYDRFKVHYKGTNVGHKNQTVTYQESFELKYK